MIPWGLQLSRAETRSMSSHLEPIVKECQRLWRIVANCKNTG